MGRPVKRVQTNFSSGEVDPLMRMRTETGAYANAASRLRNVRMLNTGGVERRPGLMYKANLAADSRLIPFDQSVTNRYCLAFSAGRLDVYSSDGALLATVTGCVWTLAEVMAMTWTQSADVMIVANPSWFPQKITRISASSWTVANFAFDSSINGAKKYQPYAKIAADTVTLSLSATSGSGVTCTASASVFLSTHVGAIIRWHGFEILITAYTSGTVVTGTVQGSLTARGNYDIDPFKTTNGSTTVEVTHALHGFSTGASVTIGGANATNGITAADLNGARTITVTDDNHYTIVAGAAATSGGDGGGSACTFTGANLPTRSWDEQVFSTPNGFPQAVCFHEGRLWFGGSTQVPDGIWGSKVGQFFNFDVGDGLDDDSIGITIGSDDISSVKHIISNRDLQIFTASSEFYVQRNALSPITPSSIRVIRQTPYGVGDVTPHVFDGATIFVQGNGRNIREFLYGDAENAYNAVDLTVIASHLIVTPVDMHITYGSAYAGEQYAYVVNSDGTLAVFLSARSEKVAGWSLWSLAGTDAFHSVCCIGNNVFFAVQRGATYTLEQLATDDNYTLDKGVTYTGASATVWSVPPFTTGTVVAAIDLSNTSAPKYLGTFTVSAGGTITLPNAVTSLLVGFSFDIEIRTLPVDITLADGPWAGQWKRIAAVTLFFDQTFNARLSNNVLELTSAGGNSTEKKFYLLGYSRSPYITITQSQPEPIRVLGIALEVGV